MRDPRRGAKGSAGQATLREALRALLARDEEAATAALEALARADSSDDDAYRGLAEIYRRRGEIGRAIRIHQNLLLRSGLSALQRAEITLGLAVDLREGGFRERAIATYEEVLGLASQQLDALAALVELSVETGDAERALRYEKQLARAERAVPPRVRSARLVRIGRCAFSSGQADLARKAVKRALRCDRDTGSAYALLAELEAERGRNRQALGAWRRAAELEPNASASLLGAVGASFAACERSEAFDDWLRARLEARPEDATARCALALRLAASSQLDEAVGQAEQAIASAPSDLHAHAVLGRLLLAAGRAQDALKAYETVLGRIAPATATPASTNGRGGGDA